MLKRSTAGGRCVDLALDDDAAYDAAVLLLACLLVSMPSARDVAARYAAAVVVVERALPSGTVQKSQGFYVASSGVLVTVLPGAKVGDAVSVDDDEGDDDGGVISAVDDDGLALVDVKGKVDVAALGVSRSGKPSTWMVGLSREKGAVQGALGGLEEDRGGRWRLLLPLPRGAPVLDDNNDVVAVAVRGLGGGQLEAVSVARVKALVARLPKS